MDELADAARAAYRDLVWETPQFEDFFRAATPIDELSRWPSAHDPAARGRQAATPPRLESLRAIPWVFAWSQSRTNLPGWYGIGTALSSVSREHMAHPA